jgi:hypothetical protein
MVTALVQPFMMIAKHALKEKPVIHSTLSKTVMVSVLVMQ